MAVSCERTRTIYYPIPKVACTSLKKLFWELNTGSPFPSKPDMYRRVLRKFRFQIDIPKIQREPGYETAEFDPRDVPPDGFESVVLIRDPVRRLRSAWASKVSEHVFRRHGEVAIIRAAGLSTSPSFAEFIDNFDIYRSLSHPVRRHTESYSVYIGHDLNFFDNVIRLEEMHKLETLLSQRAGMAVAAPKENASSRKLRDDQIDGDSIDLLREITQREYELVARYYDFESGIENLLSKDVERPSRATKFSGIPARNQSPV